MRLALECILFQMVFSMILLRVINSWSRNIMDVCLFFFPHKGKQNGKRWKPCVFDGRWSCTAWRKPFEVSPVVFLAVLQWLSQPVLQVTQWTLGRAKFWEDKNAALLWMCYYLSTPFMFSGTRPSMTARFDSKICNTKKKNIWSKVQIILFHKELHTVYIVPIDRIWCHVRL